MNEKNNLLKDAQNFYSILKYSAKINATNDIKKILTIIADEIKEILSSNRCSLFLIDREKKELYSWVAHGLGNKEIRFSMDKGVAGYAATTGKILNIKDAYKDNRFNQEVDKKTGYITNTILCIPMKNQKGEVIGVTQVLNKKDEIFTSQDEEILGLLSYQVAGVIENVLLYDELKRSFSSFIKTLSSAIDARDPMTAGHSARVRSYSILIAKTMGYAADKLEIIDYSALLHDLGKIGVRDAVLTKPGRLDKDEYIHIQTHASVTKKILEETYFNERLKNIPVFASSHHENFDGSGYPEGLKGKDIPEISRIMAIADVFDAITFKRHYRAPMPFEKAVSILKEDTGKKFDPECMKFFLNLKLYDVLRIMGDDAKNKIPVSAMSRFKEYTVVGFAEMIEKFSENKLVKEFYNYYPARML